MEYIYLLLCLGAIVFSADWLVAGAVTIAKRFKISDFVIGAVIVGVGTSLPELVVSSIGAINGNSDIALGNVIGSNIFNVLGILGLTAIIAPVAVSKENKRLEIISTASPRTTLPMPNASCLLVTTSSVSTSCFLLLRNEAYIK